MASIIFRVLYAVLHLLPTKRRIAFLSRQTDTPSLDFKILQEALAISLPNYELRTLCYRDNDGSPLKNLCCGVKQMHLVATSQVCIIDGYIPAVCIPNLSPELTIIQLWHGMGAIKKFAWQAVGTPDGRTIEQASKLKMHNNYHIVISCGEGCVTSFSEAFKCPQNIIEPLGLPRMDYLLDTNPDSPRLLRYQKLLEQYTELSSETAKVLFAPTLRREDGARQNLAANAMALESALQATGAQMLLTLHPLVANPSASYGLHFPGASSIDLLEAADYVITDYSAFAFEAALLGKKVYFYVPDIEDYRVSPGLNVDPVELFPAIAFANPEELSKRIVQEQANPSYQDSGFWDYCNNYLSAQIPYPGPGYYTSRISELVAGLLK